MREDDARTWHSLPVLFDGILVVDHQETDAVAVAGMAGSDMSSTGTVVALRVLGFGSSSTVCTGVGP